MYTRALLALTTLLAVAIALEPQYEPSSAISNLDCYGALHTHALWLPGVATNFVFLNEPQPPRFDFDANTGTATLTGRAQDGNVAFDVDVTFGGFTTSAPEGSPKTELNGNCYTGEVNPQNWAYFSTVNGYLTAVPGSLYEGGVIALGRFGPAMQIGVGANGKNTDFGFSAWLSRTVTQQPTNGNTISFNGDHGDFNVNLAVVVDPGCGCGSVTETLYSGQSIDTGSVTWNYDGEFIFAAQATNQWVMRNVHIHVSNDPPPLNGANNPAIGHFEYHFYEINSDYFTVAIDALDVTCGNQNVYIAFHADMELLDGEGNVIQEETGWAEGPNEFQGNRWGWYSNYDTCCNSEPCDFVGCQTDSDCYNGGNNCAIATCFEGNCELSNNDAYSVPTTCGVGACASTGTQTCQDMALVDSCDVTSTDGLVAEETTCGTGACASTGQIVCANGEAQPDTCDVNSTDGNIAEETTCGAGGCASSGQIVCANGAALPDTCDVNSTDGIVLEVTTCGAGACASSGEIVCANGEAQPDTCDINSTDGVVLEQTTCGLGACASSGQIVCASGAAQPDTCDINSTDGNVVEETTCGVGACASGGQIVCANGEAQPDTCDINSTDGFVVEETTCGVGACASAGQIVCANGAALPDTCDVNSTDGDLVEATTCGVGGCASSGEILCANGEAQPDTCDINSTDGVVLETTTCGVGACASAGQIACASGEAQPDTCNINSTDGLVLEETTCGLGECASNGQVLCANGAAQPDSCAAPLPSTNVDIICDGLDENCNGLVDEDFVPQSTTCGIADCASTGVTSCGGVAGILDSCNPSATDNQQCNTDLCILGEFCSFGVCGGGAAKDCSDQNDCTTDFCDSAHGFCEHIVSTDESCGATVVDDVIVDCALNTTTICYTVYTNSSPELSHQSFCSPDNVEVTGTGPNNCPSISSIGPDGSIASVENVVKFECGSSGSQPWSGEFCLTYEGVYDITEANLAWIKRGRLEEVTQTIGIAECGQPAVQSDICESAVAVNIDLDPFSKKKAVRAACSDQALRLELAELASTSVFATTILSQDDDHVTVTFVNSASASAAEAAATLIEQLQAGVRVPCLSSVEAVAVVDVPYYSSYEFDGFSNGDVSNSGSSGSSQSAGSRRSNDSSDASAASASALLLLVALVAVLL